jgi:dGTPase
MQWQQLLIDKRLGKDEAEKRNLNLDRTSFQQDYDRLVFSSHFRCLKDKTQVFPLAKNDYIRTRLIHSLEVACVGRSLGRIVGKEIIARHNLSGLDSADFGDLVAAACLAHDIGNPPFGHAGEDAIRVAFKSWYTTHSVKLSLTEAEKNDFDRFEGNAQGFRIISYLERFPRYGGIRLTYPTLATFTKYPRESFLPDTIIGNYKGISTKKYGFFQAEKELFQHIADTVGLIHRHRDYIWYARHPLTFLMEAADDICYSIVDLEDGCRMGAISFAETRDLLQEIAGLELSEIEVDREEIIKTLASKSINKLITEVASIFLEYEADILAGKFDESLLSKSTKIERLKNIEQRTSQLVYRHPDNVRLQVAGYKVLGELFSQFANAVIYNSHRDNLILHILPFDRRPKDTETTYQKLLRFTDYLCSLADSSAIDLYQQIEGISLN